MLQKIVINKECSVRRKEIRDPEALVMKGSI